MLTGKLLIDGPTYHASDFVTELFNLGERCILGRPFRSVSHCCQSCHALIESFLRLVIQNDWPLSFLAHGSFLFI